MDYALPVVFAVGLWWLSTVVLIYRAGLSRRSFAMTMALSTLAALAGAGILVVSRNTAGIGGAYLAFAGAVLLWAWHEVSYLFGYVSGPRPQSCPTSATGWRRFVLGVKTCAYHELAIVLTAGMVAVVTWNAPNRVGLWTFVILWLMRWSAKLNIFLGVRNLHEEFWPEHLAYLKSYVTRRPMNALFPVSILISSGVLVALVLSALGAGADPGGRAGAVLLATLLALAIVEHALLVLPIRDDRLWSMGTRSRRNRQAAAL